MERNACLERGRLGEAQVAFAEFARRESVAEVS
jgi:hypothetical protein